MIGIGLLLPLIWLRETIPEPICRCAAPGRAVARAWCGSFAHPQSRYFLLLSAPVMSVMVFNLSALRARL